MGFMKARYSVVLGIFLFIAAGCDLDSKGDRISIFSVSFDFNEGEHGWQHGFSDFPAGPDDSIKFELKYAYIDKPANLNGGKSIMLSGNNRNGDLFMFLKKKLTGLQPNADYTITFKVEFASDAKAGITAPGGAPGEGVLVKVGATEIEPKSVIENGKFVMNIDKGNQNENGEDMILIGDIASRSTSTDGYSLIALNNSTVNGYGGQPTIVRSNSKGELWLVVGTDSEFRGTTTLYYTRVDVFLRVSY
jgi:hypothetical protein